MEQSPTLCAESYPDECWLFCSMVTLVATRMLDAIEGSDHGPFVERFMRRARATLTDRDTGLLISSFTLDGSMRDGPEGSSLWMAIHCLAVLDPELARAQYRSGKEQLGLSWLGYSAAREWPESKASAFDVDVGLFVPGIGAAAASSAFAIVAASSMGDRTDFDALLAALGLFGGLTEDETGMTVALGNELANAVLTYALVQGPLWALLAREAP
jgi:hypothetical protein